MKVEVKNLPKSTVQLDITVPAEKVSEARDQALDEISKEMEIKGFRKGNAPKEVVEKSVDESKLHGEMVNILLEKYYVQALKEHKINPVSNPKVEIKAFDPEKDFSFTATVAVRPEVDLGDYKQAIKEKEEKIKEEAKKQKEESLKKGEPMENVHAHLHPRDIIEAIVDTAELEVPEMLVEDEVDRMMSRLVDQMQQLNMQMEQYLKAQNKTAEQIRREFSLNAERNLKAEFAMAEAVKEAEIEVTDEEIKETAEATGDPQTIANIQDPTQRWYIKSVLEKNKLISNLLDEFGGVDHGHSHATATEEEPKQTDKENEEDIEDSKGREDE